MSPTGSHVVIAADKFKGSLTAAEVAEHLSRGLRAVVPEVRVVSAPVADGGEGTVAAALLSGYRPLTATVTGADGRLVPAVLAVGGDVAVVELAQASGLQGLTELRSLQATSFGTGQLITAALDAGCRTIVLGLGGSASTDGGAGLVQALGARLLDRHRQPLGPGGGPLLELAEIELNGLDPRLTETTFVLASDVDNVLLGPGGAAAVFGPQKGAVPEQVDRLEAGLAHWADVVRVTLGSDVAGQPGAGAAGGVGYAAMAFLHADPRSGVEVLLQMIGFAELVRGARLVITGEGSLDTQSLGGKAPVGVARVARGLGVPTVAVAGVASLPAEVLRAAGFARAYTLHELEPDLARCLSQADELLERTGRQVALDWLTP